MTPAGA